jgi:hypothetical protein
MNWWHLAKIPIIKTLKFSKKKKLHFISCNLLSLNENIRLPINDGSSNINNFTCAYFFIKTSRLSSSSALKSLIDLFNGMDNAKCIVNPPILYVVFLP